jgi:hypothetical protein
MHGARRVIDVLVALDADHQPPLLSEHIREHGPGRPEADNDDIATKTALLHAFSPIERT